MGNFARGGFAVLAFISSAAFANPEFQTPLKGGALQIIATNPDHRAWKCSATWKLGFDNGSAPSTSFRDARFSVPPDVRNRLVYRSSAIAGRNFQIVEGPTINCN
jgi:hypothetical protein